MKQSMFQHTTAGMLDQIVLHMHTFVPGLIMMQHSMSDRIDSSWHLTDDLVVTVPQAQAKQGVYIG